MNKAKCKKCGDIIQSKYRHDFVSCKCGEIFVDGGEDYYRRGAKDMDNFIDLQFDNLNDNSNDKLLHHEMEIEKPIPE